MMNEVKILYEMKNINIVVSFCDKQKLITTKEIQQEFYDILILINSLFSHRRTMQENSFSGMFVKIMKRDYKLNSP